MKHQEPKLRLVLKPGMWSQLEDRGFWLDSSPSTWVEVPIWDERFQNVYLFFHLTVAHSWILSCCKPKTATWHPLRNSPKTWDMTILSCAISPQPLYKGYDINKFASCLSLCLLLKSFWDKLCGFSWKTVFESHRGAGPLRLHHRHKTKSGSFFDHSPRWFSGKESACQCRRHKRCGFNLWVGLIPGEGNGYPLQYSCLENSMNRGPWVTGNGVAKS